MSVIRRYGVIIRFMRGLSDDDDDDEYFYMCNKKHENIQIKMCSSILANSL